MQLRQQQTARRSVSRGARARTRLAKGMMASLPHEAYAPTQPFLHALHGADAPSDARTTIAAIATPHPWGRVPRAAPARASPSR